MNRLDVGEVVKTAYGSLWLQRRALIGWSVVPWLLVAVIDLLARPYMGPLDGMLLADPPTAEWQTALVLAAQLRSALQLAVWTVLEIACYRLFLLGSRSELPAPQMRAIYVSLLVFNIALTALAVVPDLVFDYLRVTRLQPGWQGVSLLYFFLYIFIAVRLAFVFPAISLGLPWDLGSRWAETQGNFWRLLAALFTAYLTMFLLTGLFSAFGLKVTGYAFSPDGLPVLEALARSFVSLVFLLAATAVTAAAVSQITGRRAQGMTGQGPGPTEIASRFD